MLPEPQELREVPAVALCAICGDPSCVGHDHEVSGERPIHRLFAWEDGETTFAAALWSTAIASTRDLDLWVRASRSDKPVGSAVAFAFSVESAAVGSVSLPGGLLLGALLWANTGDRTLMYASLGFAIRASIALIPLMVVIHVTHQWFVSRYGDRHGRPAEREATLRAGLFACGWDLTTGPAGVLAAAARGDLREARARIAGNSTLYREATERWLEAVHGVDAARERAASRGSWPVLVGLVIAAVAAFGWALVASFRG
jgi:hypothetical protein